MEWPCKLLVVGGSETGKTFLMKKMLMRADFGGLNKNELDVIVCTHVKESLNQNIWKDLQGRDFNIIKILADRHKQAPQFTSQNLGRKKLVIIDDVDDVCEIKFKDMTGRDWIKKLFSVDSHHCDMTVVLISHTVKFSCPTLLNSANYIILTSFPYDKIVSFCNDIQIDKKIPNVIRKQFERKAGHSKKIGIGCNSYNHVVILMKEKYDENTGERMKVLYRLPDDVIEKSRLIPIEY